MRTIPKEQVYRRLRMENPWWVPPHEINAAFRSWRPRAYLQLFLPLLRLVKIRRAILLMGPRRVGKTVLIHHAIQDLLASGVSARNVCYISVDHPIYNGCGLEDLLEDYREAAGPLGEGEQRFVFFDEVQYLRDWEIHLKALVDEHPDIKFVASGSAAAALRLKSHESGAGRFTEFLLPPLTFHEYLELLGKGELVAPPDENDADEEGVSFQHPADIAALNQSFVHYLNFGGYPEVIFSEQIQADPGRFIKADIIDKVLLRDLPGIYGIQDIQELNYLFTTLAYNTAQEVSLEQISKSSGVAKNTIKRYIEYLEAAFLLKVVHRIDRSGKRFQRANFFKIYLTNPSIRAALFSPVGADDDSLGPLAETGIFSQWFHDPTPLHYARWGGGEVDIVAVGERQRPRWAVEVKWSDRCTERPDDLRSVIHFCHANDLRRVTVTTRTVSAVREVSGVQIRFTPASVYCHTVGRNLVRTKRLFGGFAQDTTTAPDKPEP